MNRRIVGPLLLVGFLTLAVLFYRNTASYPVFVQGSTASYVRFLALSLGILSVADLLLSLKRQRGGGGNADGGEEPAGGMNFKRFWALLILLVLYSWALGPFGFFLASVVFLPVAMFAMGSRRVVSIAGTSAGILVFTYFVFDKLLEVPLPQGTLF